MITEDYVSFETAKLLKEKGFDVPCYGYYYTSKYMTYGDIKQRNLELFPDSYSAPTLQMAMKWLREKHIVIVSDVETFYADGSVSSWVYHIWCDDNFEENNSVYFKTYEEACEAGIKYCLENLI